MKSPNFSGSRMKKTGVLFPTRSQFPSFVKLQSESARIPLGICRAFLPAHGGKPEEGRRFLPSAGKQFGGRVLRQRIGAHKVSVSARTFRVNDALGNAFAIEVRHFLEQ
jgi:hypothetical protein